MDIDAGACSPLWQALDRFHVDAVGNALLALGAFAAADERWTVEDLLDRCGIEARSDSSSDIPMPMAHS